MPPDASPYSKRQGNVSPTQGPQASMECQCVACAMPIGWQPLHFPYPPPPTPPTIDERDPRAWLGIYRVIATSSPTYGTRTWSISGAATIDAHCGRYFDVPAYWTRKPNAYDHSKVADDADINTPLDMHHIRIRPGSLLDPYLSDERFESAYPIHDRCFRLARHMFGDRIVVYYGDWLPLMLDLWQEDVFPFGLKGNLRRDYHPLIADASCGLRSPCDVDSRRCRVSATYSRWKNPELEYTEFDPEYIPELVEDMRRCDRTHDWMQETYTCESLEPTSPAESPFLPLEVKLLILDCLPNFDAAVTVRAMGWELPEKWCRDHISPDLMLQKRLTPPVLEMNFDWNRFFLLETKRYTLGYRGLRNRERIMRIHEMSREGLDSIPRSFSMMTPEEFSTENEFWEWAGSTDVNWLARQLSTNQRQSPFESFFSIRKLFNGWKQRGIVPDVDRVKF